MSAYSRRNYAVPSLRPFDTDNPCIAVEPDMEDYKNKLKLLKKTLKDYEYAFQSQSGRKPNKEDIASDPVMGVEFERIG